MAKKRRIKVDGASLPRPAPPPLPKKYWDMGWKRWFREVYARYWYVLLCLFGTSMLFFSIWKAVPLAVAVLVVIALILGEIYLFLKLWGDNGILNQKE
jgi:hypothetical protein